MKKGIKAISIAILVCFSAASLVFADDSIKTKITLTPISPIFYESYFGIDTPITGQDFKIHVEATFNDDAARDISINSAVGFELKATETEYKDGVASGKAFTLKAPAKAGDYKVTFNGNTASGRSFSFDTAVKVVENDPQQTWIRAAGIVGIVVVALVVVSLVARR